MDRVQNVANCDAAHSRALRSARRDRRTDQGNVDGPLRDCVADDPEAYQRRARRRRITLGGSEGRAVMAEDKVVRAQVGVNMCMGAKSTSAIEQRMEHRVRKGARSVVVRVRRQVGAGWVWPRGLLEGVAETLLAVPKVVYPILAQRIHISHGQLKRCSLGQQPV